MRSIMLGILIALAPLSARAQRPRTPAERPAQVVKPVWRTRVPAAVQATARSRAARARAMSPAERKPRAWAPAARR